MLSVGASLFDDRYGLAGAKPQHLAADRPLPQRFPRWQALPGDLLLQVCANTAETTLHALLGAAFILTLSGDEQAVRRNARWAALITTLANPGAA